MSAGMIPAFDFPGLITPGQLGPTIRVFLPCACAQKVAVSCTATPSVMTTASGISASIASITESFVNAGGTKPTVTFAPVSLIASATVPNTGRVVPSMSTLVPALRAFTPPTTAAPDASMRRVCFMPSDPVMPCTMIREFSSNQMLMRVLAALRARMRHHARCPFDSLRKRRSPLPPRVRQLGGLVGLVVHRVHQRHEGVRGLLEDAPALDDVVAVQSHDQRLVRLVAEHV